MANRIAVAGPFCENCPYIEADVDIMRNEEYEPTGWTFKCKNQLKCSRIAAFLKDTLQGKKHEDFDKVSHDQLDNLRKEMDSWGSSLDKVFSWNKALDECKEKAYGR